jgi:16S rRNA (uracil1498-N3)-methyltransferase
MNLVLLEADDFVAEARVRLGGRRLAHVTGVHRAAVGDELVVGVAGGRMGRGRVVRLDGEALELDVVLDAEPPAKLPLTLVLALPRPKVLNRVIAAATSMGVRAIYLINAWRVEKGYWSSPKLSAENLREQRVLGLEQGKDTVLPELHLRRLFVPFVRDELPAIAAGSRRLIAHPRADAVVPERAEGAVTLAVGPEGGFIAAEIESLAQVGFAPVTLGPRVLRVETAVAALVGRLF